MSGVIFSALYCAQWMCLPPYYLSVMTVRLMIVNNAAAAAWFLPGFLLPPFKDSDNGDKCNMPI